MNDKCSRITLGISTFGQVQLGGNRRLWHRIIGSSKTTTWT